MMKEDNMLKMLDFLDVAQDLPGFKKAATMFDTSNSGIEKMKEYIELLGKLESVFKVKGVEVGSLLDQQGVPPRE